MDSLEGLKKKIKTAGDLLSVVKTMKALAAINIRQFGEAALSIEEYNRIVDLGWQVLFRYGKSMLYAQTNNVSVLLLLGSDQGMCGRFNDIVIEQAVRKEKLLTQKGVKVFFWTVGERLRSGLKAEGKKVYQHFELPDSLHMINEQVERLVQSFEAVQRRQGIETLYILHNRLAEQKTFEPVIFRALPLDKTWLGKYIKKPWPGRCLPICGIDRKNLFRQLFRQYIFVSFYRAFAQSIACENAARLKSMQAAEKNILEMEENLEAKFRETRQHIITAELLDIIAGFEAIATKE